MISHPFRLFVLDGGSFGGYRQLFAVGAVLTSLFQTVSHGLLTARGRLLAAQQVLAHEPVNHHIRIAADGGCEMRIVGESQTVVPDVVGRIYGFGHRADG